MTPLNSGIRLIPTGSMETPTASRPRRSPRKTSVDLTSSGCETPSVQPRRSTRKASVNSTRVSFDTTFITEFTGQNWKTDTQIRKWVLSGDVLDYLKSWKSQYLDNATHSYILQNMLGIDISTWSQWIPKIIEHRPVVEASRMATDTSGWSPTEILCQRARFIVDKDQGSMLPRDSLNIVWSYEVVIRLLFAVLYDLILDREGFCSRQMRPLDAQWNLPWTSTGLKLEMLAHLESKALPKEHDEDLHRSSRDLSTIDEEDEGQMRVREPVDKNDIDDEAADEDDEGKAINDPELSDEDELSLLEHSENISKSCAPDEPDISDREGTNAARNPNVVLQHIDSIESMTGVPGVIRPMSRGARRLKNPTMIQSSPSSRWPTTSSPNSTLERSTLSRYHSSVGGMSVFEIMGLRLDADRRLTIVEEELGQAREELSNYLDEIERLKHMLKDAERRLITEEGLTNNARRETRDARRARDREREVRRLAEIRARGAELRLRRRERSHR